jgi:hypothetical protein
MKSIRRRELTIGSILYLKVTIDPCKGSENRWYGRLDIAPINPTASLEMEKATTVLFDVKGTIATADENELDICCFRFNRAYLSDDPFSPPSIGDPLWVGNEYYAIENDLSQSYEEVLLRLISMRVLLYSLANYQMQQVRRAVLHTKRLQIPMLSEVTADYYFKPHRDHDLTQASWTVVLPAVSYEQLVEALITL